MILMLKGIILKINLKIIRTLKSLWRSLKDLGMPSKKGKGSASTIGLKIDGELCFEKIYVAEKFNSFYTTVASKLVERLPESVNKFGKSSVKIFYHNRGVVPDSYTFSVVSENKVLGYLNRLIANKLSANKATGLDGIPSLFVRDGASIIACPLSHVINLSLIQGTIPDDLKSARVVPLFKKNDRTEVGKYRPVSILAIISKIFERVVYDQVESYLDQKSFFTNFSQASGAGIRLTRD